MTVGDGEVPGTLLFCNVSIVCTYLPDLGSVLGANHKEEWDRGVLSLVFILCRCGSCCVEGEGA